MGDIRREEQLRIQAVGAAISRRDWHAAEQAYNAIRDEFDRRPISPTPAAEAVAWMIQYDNGCRSFYLCEQLALPPGHKQTPLYDHPRGSGFANASPAPAASGGLEAVLCAYEAETRALPLGAASREKGDSAYNWRMSVVKDLRELAARLAAPAATGGEAVREDIAKIVYAAMKWAAERAESGKPPEWVERGNSLAQTEARRFAQDIAALAPPAGTDQKRPRVHHLGAALRGIADEHAAVLTPRQTEALYQAASKLWDPAPSETGASLGVKEAYRLLTTGDVIQHGDEVLSDDTLSWKPILGWEVGMAYRPALFQPARRAALEGRSDG